MALDWVALIQLLITLITLALTAIAWRYRSRPGGRQFVGLAGAIALLSAVYFVLLLEPADTGVLLAAVSMRDMVLSIIPILWFVFALDYTGHGRYITTRTLAAMTVIPSVTVTLLWVPWLRPLYWGPQLEAVMRGVVETAPPFGPWYWVNIGYGYVLMMGGLLLLIQLLVSQNRLYADQSVAVVIGAVAPMIANLLIQLDVTLIPLPLQPLSFAVTGLAFGFALYRFELFSVLPVTREIGRSAVVEDMQEGVVITDSNDRIVDLNREGAAVFDSDDGSLLGRPVHTVFGEQAPPDTDGLAPSEYRRPDGRIYDVTVSRIHDLGDRPVGNAIVFRDVTTRKTREQRLQVLSRLLQHDLREDLSMVRGNLELAAGRGDESVATVLSTAEDAIEELLWSVEAARNVQTALEETEVVRQDLGEVVKTLLQRARTEYPDATVRGSVSGAVTVEATIALEDSLWELLENACAHAGESPRIEVTVATEGDTAVVTIDDDGPGIPESEYRNLGTEVESAIEGGRGLGLWLAYWGLSASGGDLTFDTTDGTTVRVTLPVAGGSR